MVDALAKGLLLGLSTGGFCLGACAPAMLPYLVSNQWESPRALLRPGIEFLTGRLFAYLLLASLVLLFGARIQASPVATRLAASVMLLLSVMLILHGMSLSFPDWAACRALERSGATRRLPFVAGATVGASICPPFMLAFAYLLTVENWGPGIGFSVAFFAGTTVYMVPLFLSGYFGKLPSLRGAAEVAAVFSGVWFLAQAVALWMRH